MEINERSLKGVYEIQLAPKEDARGFFMRTYDMNLFANLGIHQDWVQENHSYSKYKGTIRGLHFQFPPFSETKLIRCIHGTILDVFVDLRSGSETFGKWDSIELSAENRKSIFIPRGFAHGFCSLTDDCEILYKVDNFYSSESESGLLWNDPAIGINWPVKNPTISEKDKNNLTLSQFIMTHNALKI